MVTGVVRQFRDGLRQIFNKSKETITYWSITRTRDANDNPIEYITPTSVDAVVQIMRLEDIQELGGLLQVGDAIVFFDHNASVAKEDKIIHQGITYRIIHIIPERVAGNMIFTQALCRREEYLQEKNFLKTLTETLGFADTLTSQKT